MTNSQRLANVRDRLLHWIADQAKAGAADQQPPLGDQATILREAILIRDEFFCGRRFYTANYQAIWFIEEDELKIYDLQGNLQCVLAGRELDAERVDSDELPAVLKLPEPDVAPVDSQPSTRRAA